MAYSGASHSEVIAAGEQGNVLLLNIDRGTVIKQVRQHCRAVMTVGTGHGVVYETEEGEGDLCCDNAGEYFSH